METRPPQVADGALELYVEARRLREPDLLARVHAAMPDEKERRPGCKRGEM